MIRKIVLEIFSRLKAWFANIDIKNVNLFNRTYKTELYIITDTLERIQKGGIPISGTIKPIKKIIARRMKYEGVNKKFDKFLIKKGIMTKKGE